MHIESSSLLFLGSQSSMCSQPLWTPLFLSQPIYGHVAAGRADVRRMECRSLWPGIYQLATVECAYFSLVLCSVTLHSIPTVVGIFTPQKLVNTEDQGFSFWTPLHVLLILSSLFSKPLNLCVYNRF